MSLPPNLLALRPEPPASGPTGLTRPGALSVMPLAGSGVASDAGRRSGGRVRLRTLVLIRWIAVVGQALALLLVHFGLDYTLPIASALAVVGLSVALNLVVFLLYPASYRLTDRGAASYLGFDLLQLAALLYLTGGLTNPFSLLILVPVTISATILSLVSTVGLGALALACVTFLAFLHFPLPWDRAGLALPDLYVAGTWAALALGMIFISIYAWQVAAEARRMSDALAATQLALAREQQLSALGGLAAAAAHELGTPLGTITLVAKELARDLPKDGPLAEDLQLLTSQVERCREILARLSRKPEGQQDTAFSILPMNALAEAAGAEHRRPGIAIDIVQAVDGPAPLVRRSPEIVHGLGNLVQNAVDFARHKVSIVIGWTAAEIRLQVQDDGPGIDAEILSALGEPYTTSRPDDGGMGLGVFIAKTLLEHTGARVTFANRAGGGCEVAIVWPRAILEAPDGSGAAGQRGEGR